MTPAARTTAYALLASDLDGTLVPLEWSEERAGELRAFTHAMARRRGLALAYVTGRSLPLALDAVARFDLPRPDYLACEVGAALYVPRADSWAEVGEYRRLLASALGASGDAVRAALTGVSGLEAQGATEQGDFKASFFAAWPPADDLLEDIRERLVRAGARATVVTSRAPDGETCLLDILPAGGAKDRAVEYVARSHGIDADHVVYAGDSGNDTAALLSGVCGVVPANASADFVAELRRTARESAPGARIHVASRPYAAGVLEGMRRYGIGG